MDIEPTPTLEELAASGRINYDEIQDVQVKFETKLDLDSPLPDTVLSVPAKLTRYGLSEIVNHLLSSEEPRPFDFLIENQFLRKSLRKFLEAKKQSAEAILVLEVVEALPEPEEAPARPHPDWISAVATSKQGLIVSGCYDNVVRVFNETSLDEPVGSGEGHTNPIKAISILKGTSEGELEFVSASKDHTLRLWRHTDGQVHNIGIYEGHQDSVECVASHPTERKFVSGSYDKSISVWSAPEEDAIQWKKVKGNKGKRGLNATAAHCDSDTLLSGHAAAVTALTWPHPNAVYSGSYDHSIRMWDVSTQSCVATWFGSKVISDISFSLLSNLLATSEHDGVIRIWDPRIKKEEIMKTALHSHKSWATSVEWCPLSPHILASGSYDGTVKVWDIRSSVPMYTMSSHEDKVLCVDWYRGNTVVSGGADKLLRSTVVHLSQSFVEEE